MKSIDQILKLTTNPHYHLKKSELDALDQVSLSEFDKTFSKLTKAQLTQLFEKYPCHCGGGNK